MKEDKIDIRDIHETFWRCRDFELSNLWQRSIFLTAFLVLCFTGYGAVLIKIPDYLKPENIDSFIFLNVLGYIISLLGIVFSILWIKMGKGSKAWYENYEKAIGALETDEKYTTKKASKIGGFNYPNLKFYKRNKFKNSIFSKEAGAYSVSKINISIGQVFLFVWFVAGLFHTIFFSIKIKNTLLTIFLGTVVLIAFAYAFGRNKTFKSSSLEDF